MLFRKGAGPFPRHDSAVQCHTTSDTDPSEQTYITAVLFAYSISSSGLLLFIRSFSIISYRRITNIMIIISSTTNMRYVVTIKSIVFCWVVRNLECFFWLNGYNRNIGTLKISIMLGMSQYGILICEISVFLAVPKLPNMQTIDFHGIFGTKYHSFWRK